MAQTARFTLGDALRSTRLKAGLEQEDVANALGMSRAAISKWERGKSQPPFWAVVEWAMLTGAGLEFFASVRPETPSEQDKRHSMWYFDPDHPVSDALDLAS